MNNKTLTLSIVIPVYNEENYIGQCLKSIADQTIKPDEVIVVDNNSTDGTVQIAKEYAFVRVLHETHQHQSFAQKKGFDFASGDIFCRIDGDNILPSEWVETIKQEFTLHPEAIAVTGGPDPYDVVLVRGSLGIFYTYQFFARLVAGHRMLWGSNFAFRSTAWPAIKSHVALRPDVWEDYDLSFLLAPFGKIRFINLKVRNSFARFGHKTFIEQFKYQTRAIKTFSLHTGPMKTLLFSLIWFTAILVFPIPFADRYLVRLRHGRVNKP